MQGLSQQVLWRRVRDYVAKYKPLLIGVTGSTNKSLTAAAIAQVLQATHRVRVTHDSDNTPLGVIRSLFNIAPYHTPRNWMKLLALTLTSEITALEPDTIVVEVGANRPGDVDLVAQQLPFQIGVVTTVGTTHTQYFGTKEMVAHEKMSLIVSLPRSGVAVLNADDPLVLEMANHISARVITFGSNPRADIRLIRAERLSHGGLAAEVVVDRTHYELHLPKLINRHQLMVPLAALAVAYGLKLPLSEAVQQLSAFTPGPGRMQLLAGIHQSTIIDDSYDASPEATLAALETLRALAGRRKIAVLGDMHELGGESRRSHRTVGRLAGQVAQIVVTVGPEMRVAAAEALATGADVHQFESPHDVGKWLPDYIQAEDVILVKGSRELWMEQIVERLLVNPNKDRHKLLKRLQ